MDGDRAYPAAHWFSRLCRGVLLVLFRSLWNLRGEGLEHLPARGPVLLVGNHPSYLDPMGVWLVTPRLVRFMAWKAIFRIPIIGHFSVWAGAFPVDTDARDTGAVRSAVALLTGGEVMGIFPEGERSFPSGKMRPFKPAAFRMAIRFQVPVVPVTALGTWRIWPRSNRLPRFSGSMTFRFHTPILPSSFASAENPASALRDEVRRVLQRSLPPGLR